ncbi:MAG: NAD(P)H-binding protein [Chitinophagaceae bacterium]
MKILLLGATGRTGRHLLLQSLERGHIVHALVRDKSKIKIAHENLTVSEGSPLDKALLNNAMTGCDAIVSALNISRNNDWPWAKLRTPKDFLSSVMENIIELAPQHSIQRIIFTSAWGVAETRKDIPGWFRWFIEQSNIRYPYDDHARQEELLKQTSLEWTAVRAAGLVNTKRKEAVIVSFDNIPRPRLIIGRRSLASFMLDVLEKNMYVKEMPVVSER